MQLIIDQQHNIVEAQKTIKHLVNKLQFLFF